MSPNMEMPRSERRSEPTDLNSTIIRTVNEYLLPRFMQHQDGKLQGLLCMLL